MSTLATPDLMPPGVTPSWRALGALTVLVLVIHALVLRTSPGRYGTEMPPQLHSQAFLTRSIEPPPKSPVAEPPLAATPKPTPKPRPVPVAGSEEKAGPAPELQAPAAIDFVAPQTSEPVVPDTPDISADAKARTAAAAPAPAASAPSAAPAGPSPTPVTAITLPASALLEYTMTGSAKGLTYHADAELSWSNIGDSYKASMTVSALFLGSRSMKSTGQVRAEGLAPEKFSDKSRSEVAAHFESEKGQISFSANTPSVPWVTGTQDRVSMFIQMGAMLAGNPAGFPVGSSISMYTVGPRDADTWTFLVEAEEKIKLPFGELATLKLTRQPRREFDQKVEIWYAPALGYLPVRNKITQPNGDFIDQQLRAANKT